MKLLFVGAGSIAGVHARAMREAGASLEYVVGRVPESTAAFAAEHGFPRYGTDFEAALAEPGLEGVVITTPHRMHAPQALAALARGLHVLVEIPIGMSLAEAQAVADAARRAGRTVMVGHTQRYLPGLLRLREEILVGRLHPYHIAMRWHFFRRENINWKGRRRSWTDDLLWHHGCHLVDAALWLLGMPEVEVAGFLAPPSPKLEIPLDLGLVLRTRAGQIITADMSYNSVRPLFDYTVIGEEDTLTFDGGVLRSKDRVLLEQQPDPAAPEAVAAQDREFLAAAREGRPAAISPEAVLPAMAVLQRVQELGAWPGAEDKRGG